MDQIREKSGEDCVKVLVGNKADLSDREVKHAEAKALADKFGLRYFETSAKTHYQVDDLFVTLAEECAAKIKDEAGCGVDLKSKAPTNTGSCMFSIRHFFDRVFSAQVSRS